MNFSARELRVAIRSKEAAVKLIATTRALVVKEDVRRSPQRPIFEAALRTYFREGRAGGRLLEEYDRRWAKAKRRETAATTFAAGRRMAERFAAFDKSQPTPTMTLIPPTARAVLGHQIRLGYDLVSGDSGGVVIRQLLTDSVIRRDAHLKLYAAACLLHYEAGGGHVERVDVWQLRFGKVFSWPRWALARLAPALRMRLDEIAQGLSEEAA